MALGLHSKKNPAHLVCLLFLLQLLEKIPDSILELLFLLALNEVFPLILLFVIPILPHTVTVSVDYIAPLKLQQETLLLCEEHLPVYIVHLVALDQVYDVQIDIELAFASFVE